MTTPSHTLSVSHYVHASDQHIYHLWVPQKSMDAERFRLHSAALELASQAMEIRKFAGTMASNKYGSNNSSSRLVNHGGSEENKFKGGAYDGDRNARNVNKENSLSFPPPMLGSMHQLDHIASTVSHTSFKYIPIVCKHASTNRSHLSYIKTPCRLRAFFNLTQFD